MLSNEHKLAAMSKLVTFRLEALLDLFSDIDECCRGSPNSYWGTTNNLEMLLEVVLDLSMDLHYSIRDRFELTNDSVADCLEQYIKELSNDNNHPA